MLINQWKTQPFILSSSIAENWAAGERRQGLTASTQNGDARSPPPSPVKPRPRIDTTVTDAEVGVMIEEMDADHDGFVDKKEFKDFQRSGDDVESELKDAFDAYDLDRNGLISAKELQMALRKLGDRCGVEDCERMIRSVDGDKDGCVDFGEFKRMMMSGKRT
ncbi:uncharacterized protein A4U43_C08F28890 [Asparagus officinalis]|uniref:probable calcium-binding protein CML18 n=1 Tax=Asparagus officinalis TaxID=4686 RepID=UPI00098E43E7|nr:probable calcium-binding protein CML18 [Asparagus officinalis]ONK61344.1 uncharacterized protein A4U43_C08F28890 [Asparagus officinalis]